MVAGNHGRALTAWKALRDMPVSTWLVVRPVIAVTAISLVIFSLARRFHFQATEKLRHSIGCRHDSSGLSMMAGGRERRLTSRWQMWLDFKSPPRCRWHCAAKDHSTTAAVSFYLNRKFLLVNQNRKKAVPIGKPPAGIFVNDDLVLKKWAEPDAVYLIVEQTRADYWKQLLTGRFHIYHQVITCGTYVVLANQM
jgi:hypothetical protein